MSAKIDIELLAKDKASGTIKGVFGEIIKGQAVIGALKTAWSFLNQTVEKGLQEYKAAEQAEAKLNSQISGNIKSFTDYAKSIQDVTTFTDDSIISAMSLARSMGIQETSLKSASKEAIGLSEAYGVDLNQAMKMVAMAGEDNYTMLSRYIPALKNATTEEQKHAIYLEATAKGYDLAKVKAETFTGQMQQLQNTNADTYENIGKIISVVGIDLVKSFNEAGKGLNNFIEDEKNFSAITNFLSGAVNLVTGYIKSYKDSFDIIIKTLKIGNKDFELFKNIMNGLATAFVIVGSVLKLMLVGFADFVAANILAAKAASAFWKSITGSKSEKEQAKKDLAAIGDSYKELGKNLVDVASGAVKDVQKIWSGISKVDKGNKKSVVDTEGLAADVDKVKTSYAQIGEAERKYSEQSMSIFERMKIQREQNFAAMTETVNKWGSFAVNQIQGILSTIQGSFNSFFEEQLAVLDDQTSARLEKVTEGLNAQLEAEGLAEETRLEKAQAKIDSINNELQQTTDAERQAALRSELNEAEKEKRKIEIQDAAEAKKNKIQENAAKKEKEIKKKQFEMNKAITIANIWLDAAKSVMGWWASFASMGIPGIVLAGVMSGVTLTMAGIQTGFASSQSFHGEQGGIIPTGNMTGDNTLLYGNKGEALIRNDDYNSLVAMAKSGGAPFNIYGNISVNANNSQEFIESMRELRRIEEGRR